jgi:hypothetical protein
MSLKEFVEQNPHLVKMNESVRYPGLFVLKYKIVHDYLLNGEKDPDPFEVKEL